ncbi:MAG: AAA family ATPase [Bryobacteraceae bacterium]
MTSPTVAINEGRKTATTLPTVSIAVENSTLWDQVQWSLQGLAVRVVLEQRDLKNWPGFIELLEGLKPEVVLLDITPFGSRLDESVRAVRAATPNSMLIVLHTAAEPEAILTAMRAGANEFLYPPFEGNLRKALAQNNDMRARAKESTRPPGKIVGFLAAKGGCGATTVACHLAVELGKLSAERADRSLLLDLDLQAGIIGFLMKVKSPYSMLDAVQNLHRLDISYWNALVSNEWPGLEIIPAPSGFMPKDPISGESLRQILSFVRTNYPWTIADLGSTLDLNTVTALDEVDDIYLVTTLEVPSLHQAKQTVQTLLNAGYGKRLHVILNRTPQRPDVSPEELERILGLPLDTTLPNDYYSLYDAFCKGKLLPPGSHLGRQISAFAMRLAGIPVDKGKRRFGLFG